MSRRYYHSHNHVTGDITTLIITSQEILPLSQSRHRRYYHSHNHVTGDITTFIIMLQKPYHFHNLNITTDNTKAIVVRNSEVQATQATLTGRVLKFCALLDFKNMELFFMRRYKTILGFQFDKRNSQTNQAILNFGMLIDFT
jgi:hypothetical protein